MCILQRNCCESWMADQEPTRFSTHSSLHWGTFSLAVYHLRLHAAFLAKYRRNSTIDIGAEEAFPFF